MKFTTVFSFAFQIENGCGSAMNERMANECVFSPEVAPTYYKNLFAVSTYSFTGIIATDRTIELIRPKRLVFFFLVSLAGAKIALKPRHMLK